MTSYRIVLAGLLVLLLSGPLAAETKDQLKVDLDASIKTVLGKKVGSGVKLRLKSGTEITGTVVMVGSNVVQLTEVAGMEFYDAVINIDEVSAVYLKVRGR